MAIQRNTATKRYTVLFSAVPWRDANPTVFTEYVYSSDDTDAEILKIAKRQASERYSRENNKDLHLVKTFMQSGRLLTISDGFVSMSIHKKIQRRVRP